MCCPAALNAEKEMANESYSTGKLGILKCESIGVPAHLALSVRGYGRRTGHARPSIESKGAYF